MSLTKTGVFDYVPIFTLDKDQYTTFHQKIMVKVGSNNIKLDPDIGITINDIPIGGGGGVIVDEIIMSGMDRKIKMDVIDGLIFSLCPNGGAIDPCLDTVYNTFGNFGVRLDKSSTLSIGAASIGDVILGRLSNYFSTPNLVMPVSASVVIGGSTLSKAGIDYINVTAPVEISNVNTRVDSLGNTLVTVQSRVSALDTRVGTLETWRSSTEGTLVSHGNKITSLEATTIGHGASLTDLSTRISSVENVGIPGLNTRIGVIDNKLVVVDNRIGAVEVRVDNKADQSSLNAQGGRIGVLETSVSEMETAVADLEFETGGFVTRVGVLESESGNSERRITSLETDMFVVQTNAGSLNSKVATLENSVASNVSKVNSLEINSGSLNADMVGLSNSLGLQDTRIGVAETDVSTLKADVTGIGMIQTGLVASVQSAEGRIDAVEISTDGLDVRLDAVEILAGGLDVRLDAVELQSTSIEEQVGTQDSRITALENAGGPDPIVLPHYIKSTLIDFGVGKAKLEETKLTLGAATITEPDVVNSKTVVDRFNTFGSLEPTITSFPLHLDTVTGKIQYGIVPSTSTDLPGYIKVDGLEFPTGTVVKEEQVVVSSGAGGTGNRISISPLGIEARHNPGSGIITTTLDSSSLEILRKFAAATTAISPESGYQFLFRTPDGLYKTITKNTIVPDYIEAGGLNFSSGNTVNNTSVSLWNRTSNLFSTFSEEPNPEPLRMVFYNPISQKLAWGDEPKPTSVSFGVDGASPSAALDVSGLSVVGDEGTLKLSGSGVNFIKSASLPPESSLENFNIPITKLSTLEKMVSRFNKATFDPTIKYIGESGGAYFNVPMPSYLGSNNIQFSGGNAFGTSGLSMGGFILDGPSLGRVRTVEGRFDGFTKIIPSAGPLPVVFNESTNKINFSSALTLPGLDSGGAMKIHGDGLTLTNSGTAALVDLTREKLADLDRFASKNTGSAPVGALYPGRDPVTGNYTLVTANDIVTTGGGVLPEYLETNSITMEDTNNSAVLSPSEIDFYDSLTNSDSKFSALGVSIRGISGKVSIGSVSAKVTALDEIERIEITPQSIKSVNPSNVSVNLDFNNFDMIKRLGAAVVATDEDLPNLQALSYDKTSVNGPTYRKVNFTNTFAWLKPNLIDSGRVKISPTTLAVSIDANNKTDVTASNVTLTADTNTFVASPSLLTMSASSTTSNINFTQFSNLSRISNDTGMTTVGRKYSVTRSVSASGSAEHLYTSTLVTRAQEALEDARINLTNVSSINNALSFGGEVPNPGMLNTNGLYFPLLENNQDHTVFCSTMARIGNPTGFHSILSKQLLQFNNGVTNLFELTKTGIKLDHSSGTGTTTFTNVDMEKTKDVNTAFTTTATSKSMTLIDTVNGNTIVYSPDGIRYTRVFENAFYEIITREVYIPATIIAGLNPVKLTAAIEPIYGKNTYTTSKPNYLCDSSLSSMHFLKILKSHARSSVTLDFYFEKINITSGTLSGILSSTSYTPGSAYVGFIVVDTEKPQYSVSLTYTGGSSTNNFAVSGIEARRGDSVIYYTTNPVSNASFGPSEYWIVVAKLICLDARSPTTNIVFDGKIKFEYRGPDY